jgi:hypothetical protein
MDAAIESLSKIIKAQETIEADEKAIGKVLDHLIAVRANLRAELTSRDAPAALTG